LPTTVLQAGGLPQCERSAQRKHAIDLLRGGTARSAGTGRQGVRGYGEVAGRVAWNLPPCECSMRADLKDREELTTMDEPSYRAWWPLHLRVARGESLEGEERAAYEAGLGRVRRIMP
jgi:hypothetical protein